MNMENNRVEHKFPPLLSSGDRIGVAAPASPVDKNLFNSGIKVLEEMGFKIYIPEGLFKEEKYLAGSDEFRADVINSLFADSTISAVMCVRGGFGSIRMLPYINLDLVRKNPKFFIGFSDISALLTVFCQQCGFVTFHGPMVATLADADDISKEALQRALLSGVQGRVSAEKGRTIKPGRARGTISGGNLSTLCHLVGTEYAPSYKDHIVFLEDTGEALYRIDRMLTQMKLAGCFNGVAGIALGDFEDCGDFNEICTLIGYIFKNDDIPIFAGLEVGHGNRNIVIPVGATADIDADKRVIDFF